MLTIGLSQWGTLEKLWGWGGGGGGGIPPETLTVSQTKICDFFPTLAISDLYQFYKLIPDKRESQQFQTSWCQRAYPLGLGIPIISLT